MGRRRDAGPSAGPRAVRTVTALPETLPDPYKAFSDSPNLIDTERNDLAVCEAAIEALRLAFWAAGKALQVIRDARLYRATHATFEDYVDQRWDMSRAQAYRLIEAWPLAERLSPIGDKINESQVRELLPLASRHGQDAAVAVYQAVAEADGVRVTASLLGDVVKTLSVDQWDPDAAVAQIRAYLAGELQAAPSPSPSPDEAFTAEAARLRAMVSRTVNRPTFRTYAREHPDQVRAVVAELRKMLDDIEAESSTEVT